jgi:CspA family cold shock protein
MASKMVGIVKWFRDDKGYGFIQCDDEEYFVHFKEIISEGFKTLPPNATVLFKGIEGKRGMQACEVEIIEISKY